MVKLYRENEKKKKQQNKYSDRSIHLLIKYSPVDCTTLCSICCHSLLTG